MCNTTSLRTWFSQDVALETVPVTALCGSSEDVRRALSPFFLFLFLLSPPQVRRPEVSRRGGDIPVCITDNNNNVHLSCAHQQPERSHDTY